MILHDKNYPTYRALRNTLAEYGTPSNIRHQGFWNPKVIISWAWFDLPDGRKGCVKHDLGALRGKGGEWGLFVHDDKPERGSQLTLF